MAKLFIIVNLAQTLIKCMNVAPIVANVWVWLVPELNTKINK